jgi:hypothetical protein
MPISQGAAAGVLEVPVIREDLTHDQAKRLVATRLDHVDEGWREYARIV